MNTGIKDAAELGGTINAALAELDLKGGDQRITKAMAMVTEAFSRYAKGRAVTVAELIAKADAIADGTRGQLKDSGLPLFDGSCNATRRAIKRGGDGRRRERK